MEHVHCSGAKIRTLFETSKFLGNFLFHRLSTRLFEDYFGFPTKKRSRWHKRMLTVLFYTVFLSPLCTTQLSVICSSVGAFILSNCHRPKMSRRLNAAWQKETKTRKQIIISDKRYTPVAMTVVFFIR